MWLSACRIANVGELDLTMASFSTTIGIIPKRGLTSGSRLKERVQGACKDLIQNEIVGF